MSSQWSGRHDLSVNGTESQSRTVLRFPDGMRSLLKPSVLLHPKEISLPLFGPTIGSETGQHDRLCPSSQLKSTYLLFSSSTVRVDCSHPDHPTPYRCGPSDSGPSTPSLPQSPPPYPSSNQVHGSPPTMNSRGPTSLFRTRDRPTRR